MADLIKPVVHYRGKPQKIGHRASLHAIDHPNFEERRSTENLTPLTTSVVLSWLGNRIETMNTVYVPEERTDVGHITEWGEP